MSKHDTRYSDRAAAEEKARREHAEKQRQDRNQRARELRRWQKAAKR